ncbi:hypothetical protein KRX57_05480 [Weeksellaceae bacterium TAE3-ERU29]|nr:hypothetical protein [Weeksellaceae bacterium TAE3-ERU29]
MHKHYINFYFTLLALFINFQAVWAQENIIIGQKHSIHSEILNDNREYWVSLPQDYDKKQNETYPVIYFFDGENHFFNMKGLVSRLTYGLYKSMPEVILVAIIQKDRTNELTPTNMKTPEEWKRADFSTSGGNPDFMRFINQELKPKINKNYRTNGFNILAGHSFGGLATLNSFVKSPDDFQAYIALDPSLWWDDEYLTKQISNIKDTQPYENKIIYIATAGAPKNENKLSITPFMEKLLEKKISNLIIENKFYPEEDHGSVVVPGTYNGLQFIFDGYQLPVKEAIKNPNLIKEHYKKISKRLGYPVFIEQEIIEKMIEMAQKQDLAEEAEILKQLLKEKYGELEDKE